MTSHASKATGPFRHPTGRAIVAGAAVALIAVTALSCGGSSSSKTSNSQVTPTPAPSNTVWLCKPGLADNPCETDMTTTVIAADGSSTTETASPAKDPPIDCFYVYPTVSGQTRVNANLTIDPEEKAVAIPRRRASRRSARSTRRCTGR